MTRYETIYQLLDEAVDVWRPVKSQHVGGDRYRLVDDTPDNEVWPFATGDVVHCERRTLHDHNAEDEVLVACERRRRPG